MAKLAIYVAGGNVPTYRVCPKERARSLANWLRRMGYLVFEIYS